MTTLTKKDRYRNLSVGDVVLIKKAIKKSIKDSYRLIVLPCKITQVVESAYGVFFNVEYVSTENISIEKYGDSTDFIEVKVNKEIEYVGRKEEIMVTHYLDRKTVKDSQQDSFSCDSTLLIYPLDKLDEIRKCYREKRYTETYPDLMDYPFLQVFDINKFVL